MVVILSGVALVRGAARRRQPPPEEWDKLERGGLTGLWQNCLVGERKT